MAGKEIRQRIALEGAEAIKEALKSLGAAGEKAFLAIKQAAEKAGAAKPLENLNKSVVLLKQRLRDLGSAGKRVKTDLVNFGSSLGRVGGQMAHVTRNVGLLAAAVAGVTAGLVKFVTSGTEFFDNMGKQAQAVGLGIEEYQRLEFVLGQAGVGVEEFATAMGIFNKALGKVTEDGVEPIVSAFGDTGVVVRRVGQDVEAAAQSTNTAGNAFGRLGVKIRDANGSLRPTEDIILDLAEAFSDLPNGAEKSRLAMELFGARAGSRLIPFLNGGRAGAEALFKEFERLGLSFTEADFKLSEELNDSLDQLNRVRQALSAQLGLVFAPALTEGSDALASLIAENAEAIKGFARDIASQVIPVVQDLFNTLIGNDAAVRDPAFLKWRDDMVAFGRGVQSVVTSVIVPAFQSLMAVADSIAGALNGVFGTEFTGSALLATAVLAQMLGVFGLVGSAIGAIASAGSLLVSIFAGIGPVFAAVSAAFGVIVNGAIAFGAAVAALVGWPALIIAGLVAAGVAIFLFWDEISAAAQATWSFITGLFSAANLGGMWDGLVNGAVAAWDGIKAGASAVWTGIVAVVEAALDGIGTLLTGYVSAFGAVWGAIGDAAGAAWQALQDAAGVAFAGLVETAGGLWAQLEPAFTSIANGIGTAFDFILPLVQGVWDGITGIFTQGAATIAAIWEGISGTVSGLWSATSDSITGAAQGIIDAIASANEAAGDVEGAAQIAASLAEPFRLAQVEIATIWEEVAGLAQTGFEAPVEAAQSAVAGIGRVAQAIASKLRGELNSLISILTTALNRITAAIDRAISRLRQAAAEARNSGGGGNEQGFALGGFIRGSGTGTSDSVPIWASNGEFMMQARAVRKYGVQFMRLINAGRLSLKDLGGAFPGYAQGGLIGGMSMDSIVEGLTSLLGGTVLQPRLAVAGGGSFGAAAPKRPIVFNMPGGESFDLVADEDVAAKMMRFGTGAATRSAGRKPGWYK